jgi:hypothetical protein
MNRRYANILLRLAFRIFRRYYGQLPKELNGIIWGEMTRKYRRERYTANNYSDFDPNCSTCVRELEKDRASRATVERWLKGEIR